MSDNKPPQEESVISKEKYLSDLIPLWLKEHGFDGLYADECGCLADDLCPCACGGEMSDCRAGYNYGPRETTDGHAEFWIGPDPAQRIPPHDDCSCPRRWPTVPGPSPEDREAVERLDGDVNELYGNLGRNHPTLVTSEYSESRKALAHIRRRLGMEEGKS